MRLAPRRRARPRRGCVPAGPGQRPARRAAGAAPRGAAPRPRAGRGPRAGRRPPPGGPGAAGGSPACTARCRAPVCSWIRGNTVSAEVSSASASAHRPAAVDPAVVGPAVPADGGEPAAAHVVVGGPQPLLGPADVVRALAGVEQPAEHAFDDGQVVDLARADRGQRLVEAGHALGDVPGEREHDPERGERLAFEVAVLAAARGGDGLFVQPLLDVEAAAALGLGKQRPPCSFASAPARSRRLTAFPTHPR